MIKTRVVKIGGSLMNNPVELRSVVETVVADNSRTAIVNGSGELRHSQNRWLELSGTSLSREKDLELLHKQRLMGSYLLNCLNDHTAVVSSKRALFTAWDDGVVPIVDISTAIPRLRSTRYGMDSGAAYLCGELGAREMIKLTDVGGVMNSNGDIIPFLTYQDAVRMGQTCVDDGAASVMEEYGVTCYVINGERDDRIKRFLAGKACLNTKIGVE